MPSIKKLKIINLHNSFESVCNVTNVNVVTSIAYNGAIKSNKITIAIII
jgi:hypothetical protein